MNFGKSRRGAVGVALDLTPLIDVVFQLLIFFMLTATFVKNPSLDINLPRAATEKMNPSRDSLTIAVRSDGNLRLDNRDVKLPELEGVLRATYAEKADTVIVVRADRDSRHGRVVEVMDLAKRVGFSRLAVAVQSGPQ